eukprot:m.606174 g.606174  ORF g.606174 m.606174 type:complete len:157 (-) comp58112_c1_seq6:145-615(-)
MLILANCWKNSKIAQQISVLGPNQLGEPRWILLILTTRSQARFDAPCFASLFASMCGHIKLPSRAGTRSCLFGSFVLKLHIPRINLQDQALAEEDAADLSLRNEEDIKEHDQLSTSELSVGPSPDVGFESERPLPAPHIDLSDLRTEIGNVCASSE